MNLHEYQAKELFARYGLPVLPGQVAASPEEARDIAERIGGTVVIKAQVKRGKGKEGPLEYSIKVQACKEGTCLLTSTVKKSIP